jgi:glycosyltransferase involved in cell wall biosynthesis
LFLGSLDWRPNLDAIQLLLDGLFQRVRNQEPDARLLIVGRNPPAWLSRRAHETASVELHANVPDVRPFLHSAAVLAVPLRVGGGSRLKVLEALACGLPVVSTSVGYEGLALTPGRDLLVADDPEQIASALLHCLRHPQQAQALAAAGQRVVLERYDWNVLADRLERVWENLPRRPSERKPSMAASSW